MTRRALSVIPLFFACAALLVACGGEKDKGEETGKAASFTEAQAEAICNGSAMSGSPKLPANFPKPDGTTYVKQSTAGPTEIVDGTFAGDIDEGYSAYQTAVKDAGYDILFNEKEEDDAEISYKGDGTTGQIALRAECGSEDKIIVHITNRPA